MFRKWQLYKNDLWIPITDRDHMIIQYIDKYLFGLTPYTFNNKNDYHHWIGYKKDKQLIMVYDAEDHVLDFNDKLCDEIFNYCNIETFNDLLYNFIKTYHKKYIPQIDTININPVGKGNSYNKMLT